MKIPSASLSEEITMSYSLLPLLVSSSLLFPPLLSSPLTISVSLPSSLQLLNIQAASINIQLCNEDISVLHLGNFAILSGFYLLFLLSWLVFVRKPFTCHRQLQLLHQSSFFSHMMAGCIFFKHHSFSILHGQKTRSDWSKLNTDSGINPQWNTWIECHEC